MSINEKRSPWVIIGLRHPGRSFLVAIKGYSSVLQEGTVGEMSEAHQQALKIIFDCCDTPWESWAALTELIEQNEDEESIEILSQIDGTGPSYLERNFIHKSLASMEVAQNESGVILQQAERLTDEQRFYVELIEKNCQREIEVWKEVAKYFS